MRDFLIHVFVVILLTEMNPISPLVIVDLCPQEQNWTASAFSAHRCFKSLPPSSYLESAAKDCRIAGGLLPNVGSIELAMDLVEAMKHFKLHSIWVDAKLHEGNYNWIDGRRVPDPMQWCAHATKNKTNITLMCPHYDSFSVDTCCFTDTDESSPVICVKYI